MICDVIAEVVRQEASAPRGGAACPRCEDHCVGGVCTMFLPVRLGPANRHRHDSSTCLRTASRSALLHSSATSMTNRQTPLHAGKCANGKQSGPQWVTLLYPFRRLHDSLWCVEGAGGTVAPVGPGLESRGAPANLKEETETFQGFESIPRKQEPYLSVGLVPFPHAMHEELAGAGHTHTHLSGASMVVSSGP